MVLLLCRLKNNVVRFVSIHFNDFWNLSVRKTHFTPNLWTNPCCFVSLCLFYFRFQYLIHLSWCMLWSRSNLMLFLVAIQLPQHWSAVCVSSVCCLLKQDWFIHLLFSHLLRCDWAWIQSCLPSSRVPLQWCLYLSPCCLCLPQQL